MPLGAYDKKMMEKAMSGEPNEYYRLIECCLEFLQDNKLLEIKKEKNSKCWDEGFATERLKSICPEIEKVLLPSIKSVLDTEREIRKEMNYRKIIKFLEHLEKVNEVKKSDSVKYITDRELYKLAQLGVITLYLNDMISITTQGNILKSLLAPRKLNSEKAC